MNINFYLFSIKYGSRPCSQTDGYPAHKAVCHMKNFNEIELYIIYFSVNTHVMFTHAWVRGLSNFSSLENKRLRDGCDDLT